MTTDATTAVAAGVAAAAAASHSSSGTNLNSTLASSVPTIVSCTTQNEALLDALVCKVVNDTIFPKKQFIVLERELDSTSKLAGICMSELKLDIDQWDGIKNLVRKRLNRRRNNAQCCVRRSLKSYFDKQGIAKVDLRKVLLLRKEKESFHWFIDTIASAVVGTAAAEKLKYLKPPREWLSRSLEAFALLCLENYWDMVRSEVRKDRIKEQPRWTKDARGKRKNQGWEQAGIRRYNQLVELVKENRELYPGEDDSYLNQKRKEREELQLIKFRKKQEALDWREQGLEQAADDFSSDSDAE